MMGYAVDGIRERSMGGGMDDTVVNRIIDRLMGVEWAVDGILGMDKWTDSEWIIR